MGSEVFVTTLPFCDLKKVFHPDTDALASVDGKTKMGPWANMCTGCFEQVGIGLGTGKGQKLTLRARTGA